MSAHSDYEQHQLDEQSGRELDAHQEHLKKSLEAGKCPECSKQSIVLTVNPKSLTFRCGRGFYSVPSCDVACCGWFAIYPIAVIGNSSPLHAENAELRKEVERLRQGAK